MVKNTKKNQNKQKQQKQQQKQQPKVTVKVTQPKANNKQKKKQQPKRRNQGGGSLAITSVNEGVGFVVKPFMQDSHVMEGCDYIADIIVPPGVSNSSVLFNIPINPLTIAPVSRLAEFAALYDKFRFMSLSFHYATSVGTQTAGAFLMSWDADTDDNYSNVTGTLLNTMLVSTPSNCSFSSYRNASMSVPGSKELFCQQEEGADPRLVNHGRLWFVTEGGVAAGTYGRLLMKWRIRFSKPNIDPDNLALGYAATVVAPSGTYISDTYPWGDFSNIIANTTNNVSSTYNPSFVQFQSTIPGGGNASCLVFNTVGQYRVCLVVTGTALGSGTYTPSSNVGTVITGTGTSAPAYPFAVTALAGITNGGSTAVQAWFDVQVTTAGGYVACTGASGTHSTGLVTVMKFPQLNTPPPSAAPKALSTEIKLAQLEAKLALLTLGPKLTPKLAAPATIDTVSTGTMHSVPSPAAEPVQDFALSTASTSDVGLLDVLVADPPPLESSQEQQRDISRDLQLFLERRVREIVARPYVEPVLRRLLTSQECPNHLANYSHSELDNKIFSCFMAIR